MAMAKHAFKMLDAEMHVMEPVDPWERSWLKAGRRADGLDAKFIFLRIGFNALYGQEFATDRVDRASFLGRIRGADGSGAIHWSLLSQKDSVFYLLGQEFLYHEYWRKGYTDALAQKIEGNQLSLEAAWTTGQSEACLPAIFECLYELRNRILHGSAKFGSAKNRDSLEAAVPVLEELGDYAVCRARIAWKGDLLRNNGVTLDPSVWKEVRAVSPWLWRKLRRTLDGSGPVFARGD